MASFLDKFQSPGQALKYFLDKNEWTQEDLALILSISPKHLNEIIKNKKPISIEIAKLLQVVFEKTTAIDWIELRIKNLSIEEKEGYAEKKTQIYEYMPINEVIKKGWINNSKNFEELELEIKKFWGINKNDELDLTFLKADKQEISFSEKSESYKKELKRYNVLTWAQKARNFASNSSIKVYPYNEDYLKQLLNNIHKYSWIERGVEKFLNELNQAGIKFIFLSHLSKTYLDGAAFMHNDIPIITLTGRYNRVDNFWFTLAHEMVHVLYDLSIDSPDKIFIDDTTRENKKSFKEIRANDLASKALLKVEILDYFKDDYNYIPTSKVIEFSRECEIHPSIVIGSLAYNKKTSYSTLHRYKESIRDKIPFDYNAEAMP